MDWNCGYFGAIPAVRERAVHMGPGTEADRLLLSFVAVRLRNLKITEADASSLDEMVASRARRRDGG